MLDTDTLLMKRTLELAERGAGLVSPNPMVGAVLVNDGEIVGEGYHRYDLLKHAESYAIHAAGTLARGATLYCNLEPCSHHGRTPPCTDALIEEKIARAVIAVKDPDPRVNGRGIDQLREAGIEVEVGLLEDRAYRLNESYFKFITTGRPFVHGTIEYPTDSAGLLFDWQPSTEFLKSASKYDAVMLGNRLELNRLIVDHALSLERHRPLVVAASSSWLFLNKQIEGKVSVVPIEPHHSADATGKIANMVEEFGYDPAEPLLSRLLVKLRGMEVTSLVSLPGLLDSSDTAYFEELDKITLAVPSRAYEQGLATRWTFGDIEFNLEDVSVEQAGEFVELTGYPSVQEVA